MQLHIEGVLRQIGMSFVANFFENTKVKNLKNRPAFARIMNECIVAQFLRHSVHCSFTSVS